MSLQLEFDTLRYEYHHKLKVLLVKMNFAIHCKDREQVRRFILEELTDYNKLTCDDCTTKDCKFRGNFGNVNAICLKENAQ